MIEVTTYRLAAGVEDTAFVQADAAAQVGLFNLRPGLLRRTTARGDDGGWVTITLWGDADAASAAAEVCADDPLALAVLDLVDTSTLEVRSFHELD